MTRVGLFYFCTGNTHSRLVAPLEWQRTFFPTVQSLPAYLMTDGGHSGMPEVLKECFREVFVCNPWTEYEGHVYFNFAALRNAALEAASRWGLDGVFFADSDTIIARLDIPEALDCGTPFVY